MFRKINKLDLKGEKCFFCPNNKLMYKTFGENAKSYLAFLTIVRTLHVLIRVVTAIELHLCWSPFKCFNLELTSLSYL